MEENSHNLHLNEIKYLIRKNYKKDIISPADFLNEVDSLLTTIRAEPGYADRTSPTKEITEETKKLSPKQVISLQKAIKYEENFNKYFSDHSQLNKEFSLKSILFEESIKNHENVVLRFIQINNDFELCYLVNGKTFLINTFGGTNEQLRPEEFNEYKVNFDKGFGKDLDSILEYITNGEKKDNTRKITIFFYGNFDNLPTEENYDIVFTPAIIDDHTDPNHCQFTLLMKYVDKDKKIIGDIVYYDTFQLCPPNC